MLPWVLLLPLITSGLSSLSSADGQPAISPSFIIREVCPDFLSEYVVLENIAQESINLKGWSLRDGEGSLTFRDFNISAGSVLAIASDPKIVSRIYPQLDTISFSSNAVATGRFALANEGDDIWLVDPLGAITDGIVYGNCVSSETIWFGPPVQRIPSADAAVRIDTDTHQLKAEHWQVGPSGRSKMPMAEFNGTVEPFSCPDNTLPRLLREIDFAQKSIEACVYDISSYEIVLKLIDKANAGVNVSILSEGQPASGISNASIGALQKLSDSGCQVKIMKTYEGFRRYDYLHCKYAVIDGCRSLVMSENWGGGLFSNRGWGAVVESKEFASYLHELFILDSRSDCYDISGIDYLLDHRSDCHAYDYSIPGLGDIIVSKAKVRPVISPDYSFLFLRDEIRFANERILIEELECDPNWLTEPGLISELFDAARRGVEVRILLDHTWSPSVMDLVSSMNSLAVNQGLNLRAQCISEFQDFQILHNKGMIVDDSCLVSSINWVNSALFRNREVGVMITSTIIADFFSSIFFNDWKIDPDVPTIVLESNHAIVEEGTPLFLNASGCSDRSGIASYEWDLGPDGRVDWFGRNQLILLPPGNHTIMLRVTDSCNNSATALVKIDVIPKHIDGNGGEIILASGCLALVIIGGILWKRINVKK